MSDLKLGKRPPITKPALRLRSILSGVVPDHPLQVNHLSIGGWQVLGNDRYGDCVAVTWANVRRILTRLTGKEYYPNYGQVIEVYKTQNPGFPNDDDGMWIHILLDYLHEKGGPDGVKPVAFAKVDHHNPNEVEAAIAIFGYVWTGINVQSANMDDFNRGQPWDYHTNSPIDGGHSIIVGGYDSDHVGIDQTMVTWGTETGFTEAAWRELVDECWVVIWPENLGMAQFHEGIDKVKLSQAYFALTGNALDLPPADADPEDIELAQSLKPWAFSKNIWSRFTKSGKAATAARKWLAAKGF